MDRPSRFARVRPATAGGALAARLPPVQPATGCSGWRVDRRDRDPDQHGDGGGRRAAADRGAVQLRPRAGRLRALRVVASVGGRARRVDRGTVGCRDHPARRRRSAAADRARLARCRAGRGPADRRRARTRGRDRRAPVPACAARLSSCARSRRDRVTAAEAPRTPESTRIPRWARCTRS